MATPRPCRGAVLTASEAATAIAAASAPASAAGCGGCCWTPGGAPQQGGAPQWRPGTLEVGEAGVSLALSDPATTHTTLPAELLGCEVLDAFDATAIQISTTGGEVLFVSFEEAAERDAALALVQGLVAADPSPAAVVGQQPSSTTAPAPSFSPAAPTPSDNTDEAEAGVIKEEKPYINRGILHLLKSLAEVLKGLDEEGGDVALKPDPDLVQRVMQGRLLDTDRPLSNVVRIFISSTFTDTAMERNWINMMVNPRLVEWCRERFHIQLQFIDMRWGVRDEATDEHQTTELCMTELLECQELSRSVCFVMLQSHKYGYRPFPPRIDSVEFEALRGAMEAADDLELIATWYKEDLNQLPASYILLPVSTVLGEGWQEDQERSAKWWSVFTRLQNALREAARKALDAKQQHRYVMSVTENEIRHGLYLTGHKAADAALIERQCLWFKRELPGLVDSPGSDNARDYVDMKGRTAELDQEAISLREELVEKTVPAVLPDSRIVKTVLPWVPGGLQPSNNDHVDYLRGVCLEYGRRISTQIATDIQASPTFDDLTTEALAHADTARRMAHAAVAHSSVLDQAKAYLENDSRRPLIVHASTGMGKSMLAAQVVQHGIQKQQNVVVRMIGATEKSAEITSLLHDIAMQIKTLYSSQKGVSSEPAEIAKYWLDVMGDATVDTLIVLDGADHLSTVDHGPDMHWMPKELPPRTKLVLTVEDGEASTAFANLVKKGFYESEDHWLQLQAPAPELAGQILTELLARHQRTLTDAQTKIVLDRFVKADRNPLFLRVSTNMTRKWRSYTEAADCEALESTIPAVIQQQFAALERQHGELFVRRCLGYISAARFGLSVAELFDILNGDKEVLSFVFQYWTPPDEKLPISLWSRLVRDLGTDIQVTGKHSIYSWTSRLHRDGADERYVAKEAKILRQGIIKYFEAELVDSITKGRLASRRTVKELLWACQQIGDLETMKKWMVHPHVLNELHFMRSEDKDTDLFRFWSATGCSTQEIIDLHKAQVEVEHGKLDGDSKSLANYSNHLGLVSTLFRDLGELGEGLAIRQQSLTFIEDEAPELKKLRQYAEATIQVADIEMLAGHYEKSMEWYNTSYELHKEQFGERSSKTAAILCNRANCTRMLGNYQGAIDDLLVAREIILETDGPEDPEIAGIENNLGINKGRLGDAEGAIESYQKALHLQLITFGEMHPKPAETKMNLALTLSTHLGRYDEAIPLFEEVEAVNAKALAPGNLVVGQTKFNFARALEGAGRMEEAADTTLGALTIYSNALGPEHQFTLDALGLAAKRSQACGRQEQAKTLHVQYFEAKRKSMEASDPHFAILVYDTARALAPLEALTAVHLVGVGMREPVRLIFGPQHEHTATMLRFLIGLHTELTTNGFLKQPDEPVEQVEADGACTVCGEPSFLCAYKGSDSLKCVFCFTKPAADVLSLIEVPDDLA